MKRLYRRFVPEAIRERIEFYAKGAVAATGGILAIVNLTVPDYSDEAQVIVGVILAVGTWLGVRQVPNRIDIHAEAMAPAEPGLTYRRGQITVRTTPSPTGRAPEEFATDSGPQPSRGVQADRFRQ